MKNNENKMKNWRKKKHETHENKWKQTKNFSKNIAYMKKTIMKNMEKLRHWENRESL